MWALLFGVLTSTAMGKDFLVDEAAWPPDVVDDDPIEGGELRAGGGGALVLEHSSFAVEVSAGLARVTLIQWFHNPYDVPLEATYLLPLPPSSAVDRMDLTCGDRRVEGFVMERDAARALYEDAKRDGFQAALLEQERDNLFTQRVAGLCPGETVEVTVQLVMEVTRTDGVYSLSLPTTLGPRYSPPWVEDAARLDTPYERTANDLDIDVYLDEGLPIESLWSDTHDVEVVEEDETGATIALAEGDTVPNRDFTLSWTLAGTKPRAALATYRPSSGDGYLALSIEPQLLGDLFDPRPRELIFLLDGSCSMKGEPWQLAVSTVQRAIENMDDEDTLDLVSFDDESAALFPEPRGLDANTREKADQWLDGAFGGGGTNMVAGLVNALDLPHDPRRLRLVVLLTDGDVGNEGDTFAIVRRHQGAARLFSIGMGDSPNRYLLEGLAEMGLGHVDYQSSGKPIGETVDAFYERIAHPAMTDVTVDWGALDVTEQYPKRIPDLWSGEPIRLVARFRGDEPTEVVVRGTVGTEEFEIPLAVRPDEPGFGAEAVEKLWARRKIRDLSWYPGKLSAEEQRVQITRVALDHQIVSAYTSLVAVDDRPSRCGPSQVLVEVPHEAPRSSAIGLDGYGAGGYGVGYGGGVGGRSVNYGASGQLAARRPAPVQSVTGIPIASGSLDRTLIDDLVKRNLNAIRYCYERELRKNPALAGRVVVKFVIAADGSVASAEVQSSTLGSSTVESCVLGRMRRLQFPQPHGGGVVIVTYPFVFVAP